MQKTENFMCSLDVFDDARKFLCQIEDPEFKVIDKTKFAYYPSDSFIVNRIGGNILIGIEDFRFDSATKSYCYKQDNKFNINGLAMYDSMMCSHFTWQKYSEEISYGKFQCNSSGEIMFNYDDGKFGVENFKKWLNEQYRKKNPVIVYYTLQFPYISHYEKSYNWDYRIELIRNPGSIIVDKSSGAPPIIVEETQYLNMNK